MTQAELFDVCKRKHGGNPESEQAFEKIKGRLSDSQSRILFQIRISTTQGRTVDDLCGILGKTPNAISGRITELRMKGKIRKDGTRKTRSGCNAAVWKAV